MLYILLILLSKEEILYIIYIHYFTAIIQKQCHKTLHFTGVERVFLGDNIFLRSKEGLVENNGLNRTGSV